MGQIRNISTQTTNVTYKMDDGTGIIEVKVWIDSDSQAGMDEEGKRGKKDLLVQDSWARVWGRLKAFSNKRHVGAHVIRPLTDKNEIAHHLLSATFVHLYFTRGPPEQFTSSSNPAQNSSNLAYPSLPAYQQDADPNAKLLPSMTPIARRVYEGLRTSPQNNEGLHVQNIAAALGLGIGDVMKAGDELLGYGLMYTTVDDSTWAVMDG